MPRSNTNWPSRKRQQFIEDALISKGHICRNNLINYFGVERSLASMDLTAYRDAGGPIRTALRSESPVPMKTEIERGIGAGRPKGSAGYYVHSGGKWITGSSDARQRAWALLPSGHSKHGDWVAAAYSAWIADNGRDAPRMATYFGISETQALRAIETAGPGRGDLERAGVWGVLR